MQPLICKYFVKYHIMFICVSKWLSIQKYCAEICIYCLKVINMFANKHINICNKTSISTIKAGNIISQRLHISHPVLYDGNISKGMTIILLSIFSPQLVYCQQ